MTLDSIRRELVLNAELGDLDLPEGSLLLSEITTSAGTELSAYRVVGGNLKSPIVAKLRYNQRKGASSKLTFVNSVNSDAKSITFPPDSSITTIRLEPLLTETPNKVILEQISSSTLDQILNAKE